MKPPNSIFILLSLAFFTLLACSPDVLACRSNGTAISMNGYMARGYGDVASVLSFGTIYLQMRRRGFALTTFGLLGMFVLLVIFNDGWHYSGLHGDCGTQEREIALQACYFIGALLLWQIGIGLITNFRRPRTLLENQP